MTYDQLRYFYEAAKFQHIGKASKSIHISPSAISAAISSLEAELEVKLFERVGKSIVLSQHGKRLQQEAEMMIEKFEGMKKRLTEKEGELSGHFRLGASHFLTDKLLMPAWISLQDKTSKLVGEVFSLSTSKVIEEAILGKIDFGLCFSPLKHPELVYETLYEGDLVFALRSKHPEVVKLKDEVTLFSNLSKYKAIIHKADVGVDICERHPVFDKLGLNPATSLLFDNDNCAIEALLHSDSWSFLPDFVVNQYRGKITGYKVPKGMTAKYSIVAVGRKEKLTSFVLDKLKENLRSKLNVSK